MVSTFVSQAGKVLGEELSLLLRHTLEETARKIAFGLPPIAAAAALFLFIGWFAAFLVNLLQTKDLLTARTAHTLRVCGGALTHKRYSLRLSEISSCGSAAKPADPIAAAVFRLSQRNRLWERTGGHCRDCSFFPQNARAFPLVAPAARICALRPHAPSGARRVP